MSAEDSGPKVFVGNLPFSVTPDEIAEAFGEIGEVTNVNIITRRNGKSLGYGFVEFARPEDADKAVSKPQQIEISGRILNIEQARPRNQGNNNRQGGPPPRFSRPSYNSYGNQYNGRRIGGPSRFSNFNSGGNDSYRTIPRRRPPPNFRDGGGSYYQNSRQGGYGGYRPPRYGGGGGGGSYYQNSGFRRPYRYPPRRRTYQDQPELSKTTLHVSNLPFSFQDQDLLDVFESYNAKSARVLRQNNGRSRGFGFVTFDSEKEQQAALQVDGITVEGKEGNSRKIFVKQAFEEHERTQQDDHEDAQYSNQDD
jgi:RNA recognition motif-containing protein